MTLTQVMEKASATFVKFGDIKFPTVSFSPYAEKPVIDYEEFVSWESLAKAAVSAPARPVPPEVMPPVEVQPLSAQFMRALEAVIREQPDGQYHRCQPRFVLGGAAGGQFRYVHEGQGDCIVGKALIKMGVPVEQVARYEGNGAEAVIREVFGSSHPVGEIKRTGQIACAAQIVNDSRQPWGMVMTHVNMVDRALV